MCIKKFDKIDYTPDWLLSDRLNQLIDKGIIKYYPNWDKFKNRKRHANNNSQK